MDGVYYDGKGNLLGILSDDETVKCAVCGIDLDEELDLWYEFRTKNGARVMACQNCMLKRSDEVEAAVAKVNVN